MSESTYNRIRKERCEWCDKGYRRIGDSHYIPPSDRIKMAQHCDADVPCTAPSPESVIEEQDAELLRLTAPLEDERLRFAEWEASRMEAHDMPGIAGTIRDLVAEIRSLRAGEDTRLLDWWEGHVTKIHCAYQDEEWVISHFTAGPSGRWEWEVIGSGETLRDALRAAVAAEGER